MMAINKVSRNLGVEIRHNYVTRLRSIGIPRKEIERLDLYLGVCFDDINDRTEMGKRYPQLNG